MSRLIYRGCTPGTDVAQFQDDLNQVRVVQGQASGQALLVVDGHFGALTQSRTLEFQRINGLGADGVAGPQTYGALSALLSGLPVVQVTQPPGSSVPGVGSGLQGEPVFGKPAPFKEEGGSSGKAGGFPSTMKDSGANSGFPSTIKDNGANFGRKAW